MLTLTEQAARHVARSLAQRGRGVGVRLAVQSSGCSGMAYRLEYVDTPSPDDLAFPSHGVVLYTDAQSLPYLDGTELHFVREGLNEGFKFRNPNVRAECGCGESFTV